MKLIAPVLLTIICLTLAVPPALSQQYGGYSGQVPGLVNDPSTGQPYGQPQFNQINSQTQVPYGQSQYSAQAPGFDAQNVGQSMPYQQYQGGYPQNFGNMQAMNNQQPMTPYQQQEAAIDQAMIDQQLQEMKNRKEAEEVHLNGTLNEKTSEAKKTKSNRGPSKMGGVGQSVKNGMLRYGAPAAGAVGSFFLLRAALRNSMLVVPAGGMMIMPR